MRARAPAGPVPSSSGGDAMWIGATWQAWALVLFVAACSACAFSSSLVVPRSHPVGHALLCSAVIPNPGRAAGPPSANSTLLRSLLPSASLHEGATQGLWVKANCAVSGVGGSLAGQVAGPSRQRKCGLKKWARMGTALKRGPHVRGAWRLSYHWPSFIGWLWGHRALRRRGGCWAGAAGGSCLSGGVACVRAS